MDVFSSNVETGFQHLCESVFVGLCRIVGTSTQVAIRRETRDILEVVEKQVKENDIDKIMLSGSRREGFRLKGSDLDLMAWSNNDRVIWNTSQSKYYYTTAKTLLLSDSSESPPGFSLLELLTPTTDSDVQSARIRMNDRLYISSSRYRRMYQSLVFEDSTEHGPCDSGVVGEKEYDFAICLVCDFWPPSASFWIDRCHSWPNKEVVDDIVRNGCHFVPIGNPVGLHGHEHEEWRISFSLAEYKLVHSMNHCQFLIYGLLKLFLKEVINNQLDESNKVLCSYHVKTAVFWVIQQNTISIWCPQNLLAGFWVCFKLLLKWVYEGVCPNFFIPENNMFLSKVHGSAQGSLFEKLHDLYDKGLVCLLLSPSIRSYIADVLYNPRLSICTEEDRMLSEVEYDIELFTEIGRDSTIFEIDLNHCMKFLHTVEQLIGLPLTQHQIAMLQKLSGTSLQSTAFMLHNMYGNTGQNRQMYLAEKISCHMLKLAVKFGCISDLLFIAIYYYKTFEHSKAVSVIQNIEDKLAQPCLIYRGQVDSRRYTEAVGGQSWSTKMRQAVAQDIRLKTSIHYINELTHEQHASKQYRSDLYIPLFVLLHFVEFLCYRHIDRTLAQTALDKLQDLVHHDQGLYVDKLAGDISWQILGICHQITGNNRAALYSFQQSLTNYPMHRLLSATKRRMEEIFSI